MIERRAIVQEIRALGRRDGSSRQLAGYAAKFGVEAALPGFTEVLKPGAFAASLAKNSDVLALVDHDPGRVLARTKSGTLRLAEDSNGLQFELDCPATSNGHDIFCLAQRGDLGGMSFGFSVPEGGERWSGTRRELRAVNLMEVSVVSAWPAYPQTEVIARARPPLRLALALRYLETC